MDAGLISKRRRQTSFAYWMALAACLLWLVVGLFLLSRRLGGAFSQSLSDVSLVGCGVVMVLASAFIRQMWLTACAGQMRAFEWLLPTVALAITAIAVSVQQSPRAGTVVFWSLLAIAETAWLFRLVANFQSGLVSGASNDQPQERVSESSSQANTFASGIGELEESAEIEKGADLDPGVMQHLVRSCDDDGNQSMVAKVRLKIAAGQQTGRVHIAFSPPFPSIPDVYIEPCSGEIGFQAKLSQAFPHGTRIDVRLDEVAESEATIELEVYAVSS